MLNAYTIMMIMVVILSFIMHGNEKGNKKFIYVSSFFMFVLMAFRDLTTIGNDSTSSYLHLYQKIGNIPMSQVFSDYGGYNFGFNLLAKIVNSISGGDYQVFIIIISAFFLFSFAYLVKKYSMSPIISICAYWGLIFYIFMFDALKQATAMSVLIFAFDAIIAKKPLRFYLLVIVASLFHAPALVFLPAYLIARIRIPEKYYIPLIALLFLVIYFFRSSIVRMIMGVYQYDDLADTYASMDVSFISGSVIVYLFIILVCYFLRKPEHDKDFIYTTLFKLMIIATILQTFCYYNNVFKRLADYYAYFSVILITFPFDMSNNAEIPQTVLSSQPWIKSLGKVVFCSYSVFYFGMYISRNAGIFLPFQFFV